MMNAAPKKSDNRFIVSAQIRLAGRYLYRSDDVMSMGAGSLHASVAVKAETLR